MTTPQSRTIRLFLSSTFRDFGEERDLLVKRVFPALRAKLRDRFVELVDVDLRWGITVEEAERGDVLPICLAEIDRARPYFIGMLGERYGWVPPPDGYAADLLERQPWLKKHQGGKSVTELEILHGVLNNRRMQGRAFFYFRSPAYARAKGGDYLPSPEDRARQTELKRRIRERGLPVIPYANPEALAKRIERDLWKLLDAEFPATSVPDAFERERLRHEAYAAPRRRLYLGGERYQAALAKLLEAEEPRIVIEGASGGGKSALLANFLEVYRKYRRRHLVHEHYLGASADAADPHALVRRLIEFIQRTTHSSEPIPGDPQQLMDSLPIWLATASSWARRRRTRFIFALDSLNSLTDQQDLRWLPAFLPRCITMLVSCLQGPVNDALKGKTEVLPGQDKAAKWKTVTVRPLTKAQSATLLNTYLARFNKKLPRQMVMQVQAHPLATNPLFLRTLAEELRLFGVHEELQKRLDHYLTSQTVDDLFERVLQRVEKDCGKKQVKAAMTAIWASRAGLTEKEILGIAGLTPATWAAIRHALDEALVEISGRITFAHDYARFSVQNRFASTAELQFGHHRKLGRWFSQHSSGLRRVREEPYQWARARSWSHLKTATTTRSIFEVALKEGLDRELWGYWIQLEANTRLRAEQAYKSAWSTWHANRDDPSTAELALELGRFLRDAGRLEGFAEMACRQALSDLERMFGTGSVRTVTALNNLAELRQQRGFPKEAESLFRRALGILESEHGPEHPSTGDVLSNLGVLHLERGDFESAEALLRRALQVVESALGPHHSDVATSVNNLASVLCERGSFDEAKALYRRGLKISERTLGPDHPETGISLNNLADLLQFMGDFASAKPLMERALSIAQQSQGDVHPLTAIRLNNLAKLHEALGNLGLAQRLMVRSLQIRERVYGLDHPSCGVCLNNLGQLRRRMGDSKAALPLVARALSIAERHDGLNHPQVARVLQLLARLHQDVGAHDSARPLLERALAIVESVYGATHPETASCLNNLGLLHEEQRQSELAEVCYRKALVAYEASVGQDHRWAVITAENLSRLLKARHPS